MAWETDFAEDHIELLDKAKTFIEANGGTTLRYDTGTSGEEELIVQLPGSGTDEIIFGMKCFTDTANDNFAWELQGYTGYSSSLNFYEQPGAIQSYWPCLPLHQNTPADSNTIEYWFTINTRRFTVTAKIGSTYQQAYMGFILPYGIPEQWPYPMLIGGSTFFESNISAANALKPYRFSVTDWKVAPYWYNKNLNDNQGQACLREPGGTYRRFRTQNFSSSIPSEHNGKWTGTWPYLEVDTDNYNGFDAFRTTLDGSYTLQPVMFVDGQTVNIYGELDGLKHVSGFSNSPENIITVGSQDWLAVPAVFRTGINEFIALELA